MDYGVLDYVAINDLAYKRNRRSHGQVYVGRKNMLNTYFDAFQKFKQNIKLTFKSDSISTTPDSVVFEVEDFEDGYINSPHVYTVRLELFVASGGSS